MSLELNKLILASASDTSHTCLLTKNVLDKQSDVLDGICQLSGECKMYLKSESVPVVHPPGGVVISFRQNWSTWQENMSSKMLQSWVISLLTEEIPNGSIRICLDPKYPNDVTKRPQYPNKILGDILPEDFLKVRCSIWLSVNRFYRKIPISDYISNILRTVLLHTSTVWS